VKERHCAREAIRVERIACRMAREGSLDAIVYVWVWQLVDRASHSKVRFDVVLGTFRGAFQMKGDDWLVSLHVLALQELE
jgi:hypothetical protein